MEQADRFGKTAVILIAPPHTPIPTSSLIDFVLRKPIALNQLKAICQRLLPKRETAVVPDSTQPITA